MRIWTLSNQKGGCGKSTVAINLAAEGSANGEKVLLIDMDVNQGTTSDWWKQRDEDEPHVVACTARKLADTLANARAQGFTLVIIDTAGKDSALQYAGIDSATFSIVPCKPTKVDAQAMLKTVDYLTKGGHTFAMVITQCPTSGNDFDEARAALGPFGVVCPTPIKFRKDYPRSYAFGQSVTEFNSKGKAADEIRSIYKWLTKKEDKLNG